MNLEYNNLSNDFMSAISKLYHSDTFSNLDAYYQGEMRVLTFLASCKQDNILPSEVSKSLNITSPRVSSILNNLEKKGYIKRVFSTIDRRKVYVSLTNQGKQYVANTTKQTYNLFYSILEKIGEDDALELIRIINRLVDV